jgi:hypothetical protein
MRVGQDRALLDRGAVTAAQPEGQPIANRIGDGIAVWPDGEPILIVAEEFL